MIPITNSKDVHTWCAIYHDGTIIDEYDATRPDGRGFSEIDSTQVKVLALSSHRVEVPAEATPVMIRRRATAVNLITDQRSILATVHCIGWKRGDTGCYLFVFEDGTALMTDNFQAV